MSDVATGQGAPAANGVVLPPVDPDAGKYEALRKELSIEEGEAEVVDKAVSEQHKQAQHKVDPGEDVQRATPEADKPKPTYEDLERNYGNMLEALRQERAAKKAGEEQLARFMRIVEESRAQRPEAKKADEPKLPDVQEDPIGHFTGRIAQLEAQLKQAHEGVQHTSQEQQAYQQQQALFAQVQRSEAEILDPKSASHKPDYHQACEFLEGTRIKQLNRMYPDDSERAAHYAQQQGFRSVQELKLAMLNQDRVSVAVQAMQLGMSPAQFYYDLAVDSGYAPKAEQSNVVSLADKAKQQLEVAKRGQAASRTISGGNSGRKGADDMAISDLAALFIEDPDAADRIWDQMAKQGKLG